MIYDHGFRLEIVKCNITNRHVSTVHLILL